MSLKKNISVNYVGTFWNIFSTYFFLPFYLKFLDKEAFGLIMFMTTIQSVVSLLDAGFSSVIKRKLALKSNDKGYQIETISFLRGVERFYSLVIILFSIIILSLTRVFEFNWFIIKTMSKSHVDLCINLLAVSALLQLFVSLYHGGLQSRERQIVSTILHFFYTLLKNGFVIILIFFFPDPVIFISWQLLVVFLFVFIYRRYLLKELNPSNDIQMTTEVISRNKLYHIFKSALPFFAISFFATVNYEVDKVLISKLLHISSLGVYGLIFSLSSASVTICSPLSAAIAPRLINSYLNNEIDEVSKLFHHFSRLATMISITISGILFIFSKEILFLWTKNSTIVSESNNFSFFLILAGVFLASQVIPYQLGIASISLKHVIYTCVVNIIITLPLYYFLILSYGLKGSAIVWLSSNIVMALVNNYFYIRKVLKDGYFKWLFIDFIGVGLLTFLILYITKFFLFDLIKIKFGILFLSVLSLVTFVINYFVISLKFKF